MAVDIYDKMSYSIVMILLGKKMLQAFGKRHPQSVKPLSMWEIIIKQTGYQNFPELKRTFPSVDYVHHRYTIFDISGNKYRLITEINYSATVVNIKKIWTHAEYSMKKNVDALRRGTI